MASWAPLIPAVKQQIGLNAGMFGVVLLCLGLGSLFAMPITGMMIAKIGARRIIALTSFAAASILPFLTLAPNGGVLAAFLSVFGAAIGSLDVAMNVNGAEVERAEGRTLMSGFHAVFSIGGLLGALWSTMLIASGHSVVSTALLSAGIVVSISVMATRLIRDSVSDAGTSFAVPTGMVIPLAIMACLTFLLEGAVLDWGALLLVERAVMGPETAGLGFVWFSVGMVLMRLFGDAAVWRAGALSVLVSSGVLTVLGLLIVLHGISAVEVQAGFFLIGVGAACIAPIVISAAGQQTAMPQGQAVAAVTTAGYGGHLMGPAFLGIVAQSVDVAFAFYVLAGMTALVPIGAILFKRIF